MPTQKITREQAANFKLLPFGKKHGVRIMIEEMEVGELLMISKADFRWKKSNPNRFCKPISKSTGARFTVKIIAGKVGWVVERIS